MALVLGTNSGFVTVAPSANPGGTSTTRDGYASAMRDTAPVGATAITEIGWWSDAVSVETNFEVGLYSDDAGNDKPLTRLSVEATNAKGTSAGWKTVAVNWAITAETKYWLAVQIDAHTGSSKIDYANTGGDRASFVAGSTLLTTWPASSENASYLYGIYAVYSSLTYSELAGTCAGVGSGSGDLELETYSALAGTCAGVGSGSGDLGSTAVRAGEYGIYKRLVAAGNNQIWYEDI